MFILVLYLKMQLYKYQFYLPKTFDVRFKQLWCGVFASGGSGLVLFG